MEHDHGSWAVIREKQPLIWIAVHPEFVEFRYGVKPLKLHKLMYEFGYECIPISTDHEEHWGYIYKGNS